MSKEERNSYYILAKGRTIPIGSTSLEKIRPNHDCKSIVVYGNYLGSTISSYKYMCYVKSLKQKKIFC